MEDFLLFLLAVNLIKLSYLHASPPHWPGPLGPLYSLSGLHKATQNSSLFSYNIVTLYAPKITAMFIPRFPNE